MTIREYYSQSELTYADIERAIKDLQNVSLRICQNNVCKSCIMRGCECGNVQNIDIKYLKAMSDLMQNNAEQFRWI